MVICRSYRPSTKLLVKIIPVLVLNVIVLATLNSCKSNTLDQPNDKHAVEEASQETIPEEPKLIGVSDDIGYNFDKKPGYEYLQVNIEVSVKEEGTYFINSDLLDTAGNPIAMGNLLVGAGIDHIMLVHETKLSAGVNIVPVYFSGKEIREMKSNGPYKVKAVLSDRDAKVLDEAEFMTSAYKHKEFTSR